MSDAMNDQTADRWSLGMWPTSSPASLTPRFAASGLDLAHTPASRALMPSTASLVRRLCLSFGLGRHCLSDAVQSFSDNLPVHDGPACDGTTRRCHRKQCHVGGHLSFGSLPGVCTDVDQLAVKFEQHRIPAVAQLLRPIDDLVEYRLSIIRRGRHHL